MKGSSLIIIGIVVVLAIAAFFLLSGGDNSTVDNSANSVPDNTPDNSVVSDTSNTIDDNPVSTPTTHMIVIDDLDYSVKTLTIKVGDSVVWINKDSMSHTVTSDTGSELNSELLSNGDTYTHTFTNAGRYDYHCKPHP